MLGFENLSELIATVTAISGAVVTVLGSVFGFFVAMKKIRSDQQSDQTKFIQDSREELADAEENFRKAILRELGITKENNEILKKSIEDLEKRVEQISISNHRLKMEKISYEARIKFLKEEVERKNIEIENLYEEIQKLEDEIENLKNN